MSDRCSCLRCADCKGSGHIWMDWHGHALPDRGDDLDTLEMCDACLGSGVSEECDDCADERERREEEEEWTYD